MRPSPSVRNVNPSAEGSREAQISFGSIERRNAIAVDAEEFSDEPLSGGGVTVGAAIALCEVPADDTEEVDEDSGPTSFAEVSGTIVDDDEEDETPLTSMRSARSLSKYSPRCFRKRKERIKNKQFTIEVTSDLQLQGCLEAKQMDIFVHY